ncbi:MAG: FAD-dependent oxidoreductase [Candidimonas sp.]|nr:MAG: FAD-dependent oxidoreductase [Candidimonas sp.]
MSPASCVPFGLPGVLKQVPGWLLRPEGPLSVRWRYLPRVLPWMLSFVANSRAERVGPIADALRALLGQTFDATLALADHAGVRDLIRQSGYLVVYGSEAAYRADSLAWKIRRDRGVLVQELDAAGLAREEPALSGGCARGVLLPEQGFVANPLRLTQSLARKFQQDGGRLLRRKVVDIEIGDGGATALVTDAEAVPVEHLVVCAGIYSADFARRLGDPVPLESQRGYHVCFEHPSVALRRPVASGEGKFFATPMETGLRVAGAVEFAGVAAAPRYARADVLQRQAQRLFPGLRGENVTRWMGHRPSTPDSLPVIGRATTFANVWYAFGHGHVGLCGSAPTGRLLADLIVGNKPFIDPAPYRPDRFRRVARPVLDGYGVGTW